MLFPANQKLQISSFSHSPLLIVLRIERVTLFLAVPSLLLTDCCMHLYAMLARPAGYKRGPSS